MRTTSALATLLLVAAPSAFAQTYTKCNPLENSCPADPALAGTVDIDFTSGASNQFTSSGSQGLSYDSNGLKLSIASEGEAPTLTSNFYLMFGRVDVEIMSSAGTGIVTSSVLQSDDLDEVDWEFLGGDPTSVQTNYFGKGITGSYDRSTTVTIPNSQTDFQTFSVDWNANRINWLVNGAIVRTLTPGESGGQYPQSPMQIKIGTWAGGDPSNAPGTIAWAGGPTDYSDGPFVGYIKSIKAQDYSTGSSYSYSGSSGTWQSIHSDGGSINPDGTAGSEDSEPNTSAEPSTTTTVSGQSTPFSGNPTATVYPWVSSGGPSMPTSSGVTSTPGLPSGWSATASAPVETATGAAGPYPTPSSQGYSASSYVGSLSTMATYATSSFSQSTATPLPYTGAAASLHIPIVSSMWAAGIVASVAFAALAL